MRSIYYTKHKKTNYKQRIKRTVLFITVLSGAFSSYFAFTFISWWIHLQPVFAETVTSPVPFQPLPAETSPSLPTVELTDANDWYPTYTKSEYTTKMTDYLLSIPKLGIADATVTTQDMDLSQHLVHYPGTTLPPHTGNAVIFGHSTLPYLFKANDYKTIFSNLYKIKKDDTIQVTIQDVHFTYKVTKILVANPNDISVLLQNYNGQYLTLITCTPPGTIWKRLVVQAERVD